MKSRARSHDDGRQAKVRSLLEEETKVYEKQEPIFSRDFNLLRLWKSASTATSDNIGNVLEPGMLSAIAGVLHSLNNTSCRFERDFSILSLTLGRMRTSLEAKKVEKTMFPQLNANASRK